MKPLPTSMQSLLIRTDFSDAAAWNAVCKTVSQMPPELAGFMDMLSVLNGPDDGIDPEGEDGGSPACTLVDDASYADADPGELRKTAATTDSWPVLFVFDQAAASHPEHAVLVMDLHDESGRSFRTTPDQIHWIESNLSIANMDWEDFAEALDEDGIHRGFPED